MDLVILHSPLHYLIYIKSLKEGIIQGKPILIIYNYQKINLEIERQDETDIFYMKDFVVNKSFNKQYHNVYRQNKVLLEDQLKFYKGLTEKYQINRVFVFSDNIPFYTNAINFFYDNKSKLFLVEDGIGHYIYPSIKQFLVNLFKAWLKKIMGMGKQLWKGYGSNNKISAHYCYFPEKSVFKKETLKLPLPAKSTPENSKINKIIYLSQPLSEGRYLSFKKELGLVKELKRIADLNNMEFVIKPHPRERVDKFLGFEIFNNKNYSAEEMVIEENAIAFSIISTAIFNLRNLYDYKNAYYLYELVDYKIENNFTENNGNIKDLKQLRRIIENVNK